MFQLAVDDEIVLVLAEERHAQAMTDLIVRNQTASGALGALGRAAGRPSTGRAPISAPRSKTSSRAARFRRSWPSTVARRFVGRCGMRINPYAGSGDIGYWIDADYEGRGIAAARRKRWSAAFRRAGPAQVELRTSVENVRSRALAERLGFTFEGILPARPALRSTEPTTWPCMA